MNDVDVGIVHTAAEQQSRAQPKSAEDSEYLPTDF